MSSPLEKWRKSVKKINATTRRESIVSSTGSIFEEEDLDNDMEVTAYLSNLKRKAGLQNLWSGHKFDGIVENDRTPDISISSDESISIGLNMEHIKGLNLDSDEDEMRIDYIREAREQDENNNDISSSSSRASLNLMQNIHFAELDNDDIQLSDSYLHKSDKSNDFLPKIEILEIDKSMEKTDSSLNERLYTLSDRKSDQGKLKDSYLSSVHSEYQRSEIESGKSRESSSSKSTSKGGHYSSSTLSSTNTKSKSSKDNSKSSSTKTLSKASSDKTSWHSVEKSEKSESGTLSETSDILSASASSRRSSRSTKSGKSTHRKKKSRRQNKAEKIFVKDNAAQTDFQDIDYTEHVLNFKYNWQSSEPSRIASHVIDGTTLDMLTNYSPAVLAANDMMKFHLDLMKKYIDSSRRLYEAYSSIDSTSNFRYTTIEDTLNYIKKNRPRVTNYEDALDHVTKESSR